MTNIFELIQSLEEDVGLLRKPEIAICVFTRMLIIAGSIGCLPSMLARVRRDQLSWLWLFLVVSIPIVAIAFPWKLEHEVSNLIKIVFHSQTPVETFYSCPESWLAPTLGIPCGILAGLICRPGADRKRIAKTFLKFAITYGVCLGVSIVSFQHTRHGVDGGLLVLAF